MAKMNAACSEFVAAHPEMPVTALEKLAKAEKLGFSKAQLSYHKTKLNKARPTMFEGKDPRDLEIAVLRNTIGSLLVTIGQLVQVKR